MEQSRKGLSTRNLILCALMAALITAGAFIRITLTPIPFTLQFTFVLLAGLLLGPKYGPLSVAVYVVLGLIGIPVFTSGGGIGYVITPTFGYLLGFIFCAFAAGFVRNRLKKATFLRLILSAAAGVLCTYLIALPYLYFLGVFIINKPLAVGTLLTSYCAIFLPTDLLQGAAAAFLAARLLPVIRKHR